MTKTEEQCVSNRTITQQFEDIKERLCDGYCKFPEEALSTHDDPDDAMEWLMHVHCEHCPLMEL